MRAMDELEEKALIECLESLGRGQSPSYVEEESGIFAINQKCVRNGAVDAYYSRPHNQKIRLKDSARLQDGDVCINSTGTGTIGRVGLWSSRGLHDGAIYFADSHVTIARPRTEVVNPKYLAAMLESAPIQTTMETFCFSGSTNQVELNRTALGALKIRILGREAQNKVATILSILDQAIEQTEAIIVKQQRIKVGLMQDLLAQGIDEHGVIRSEVTHEFKGSPLGRIPVEWDTSRIADVLTERPKNGYSPKEVDCWTGTQMLGLGCLSPDGFRPVHLKNAPLDDSRLSNALLKDGDFLISRSNTRDLVGLVGIFRGIGIPCIYPDLMVRLRFDSTVNTKFMEFIFRHHLLRSQLTNSAVGTSGSMVKINSEVITTSSFLKPNLEEQERIVCVLEQMATEISELQKYSGKLNSIKIGLMHDLLTGTVRVANP